MSLNTANKKTWYPHDTGGTVIEAEISDVIDNVWVFSSDASSTAKVRRILSNKGTYLSSFLDNSVDPATLLGRVRTAILDPSVNIFEVTSTLTMSGTINVPFGKVIKFKNGGYIDGDVTLTGGAIISSENIRIFGDNVVINQLENEQVKLHWWLNSSHTNADAAFTKAFASQEDRSDIDASGMELILGTVGEPIYFGGKDYLRINFNNSTLKLRAGLYFNNIFYFDRIPNLIFEGEYDIDGNYNNDPLLGAKWTETFLGAEYIAECQLGPSDKINLLPIYSGTLGGVSVSNINSNPYFLTVATYPGLVLGGWEFGFKPQGTPTGANKVMSVYAMDRSKKLFDVTFPASYEGQYCKALLNWTYGGTFNTEYLMLFKEGNVYIGEANANYMMGIVSPFDINVIVGNGYNHIEGSRFSVNGGYTIKKLPLGCLSLTSSLPYNMGYQFVHIGYTRNISGIGNQRSINFYDKRISEPSITGVFENINIDEVYMSDPEGLDEKLTPADGNAGEFFSRAFTVGTGVVGNDLIRTDAGNSTTRNVRIGKIHASYWLSSVLGFRGVDNIVIDEIIIDHFGCKPEVVTAYNAPKFDATNPYPYINEKYINLFKINDFDNLSQPLNAAPLRIQIGTYIVRNTSKWLLFNKTTELIAINPATGLRSVSITRFDTDMDLEGGSGQGYAGSVAGAIDISTLRLFSGASARILLNVDEMHFMEPSPFSVSSSGNIQGRVGAVYQWYDSLLRLNIGGFLVAPDYSDVSNKLIDVAQAYGTDIEKGRFINAEVSSVYTMSSDWALTPPSVVNRIKLKDVKGLLFAPFLNHIGTGGIGVVWGANEWDSNYTAVEAAWSAAKDFYDLEFIDCELKTGGAWEKIFTANASSPDKGRVRIFDTKDLSKTATWNYPNKQSIIKNCTFQLIGGETFTLDNTEMETIGIVPTVSALRNSQNIHASERVLIKSTNSLYYTDRADTASSDDGNNCIITTSLGLRWKKISLGGGVTPIVATLSANGTVSVPAGYYINRMQIIPNDTCFPGDLKIGTTPGGDQIETSVGLSANQVGVYSLGLTTEYGPQLFYFESPTWWGGGRTLQIKIVIEAL